MRNEEGPRRNLLGAKYLRATRFAAAVQKRCAPGQDASRRCAMGRSEAGSQGDLGKTASITSDLSPGSPSPGSPQEIDLQSHVYICRVIHRLIMGPVGWCYGNEFSLSSYSSPHLVTAAWEGVEARWVDSLGW